MVVSLATAAFGGVNAWSWRDGLSARGLKRGDARDSREKRAAILYVAGVGQTVERRDGP